LIFSSALDLRNRESSNQRLTTGCAVLDQALRGKQNKINVSKDNHEYIKETKIAKYRWKSDNIFNV